MDEDVRVGDVEREAAISALEEHCRAGRLGMDELLERSAAAYAARTRAELAALTGDLPGRAGEAEQPRRKDAQAATPLPDPGGAGRRRSRPPPRPRPHHPDPTADAPFGTVHSMTRP
jgi:uncharacterized protein DUF1707